MRRTKGFVGALVLGSFLGFCRVLAAQEAESTGEPWKLPQPVCLQQAGITIGGWVEQGITYNALNPKDRFNGPIATNDRAGEYQLNQFWMYMEKRTNTEGGGWDLGGRIDAIYGTDWRFGETYGLETRIDDPNSFYGLALPQFYAEVAYNDLTVKMGHFATLTSLEIVPAPANFFYSHSLLSCGYFDPLLVTGLQAEYKLNDHWTAVGGFNRGWMDYEDPSETLNFLGGARWADDDQRAKLSLMVDAGKQRGVMGVNDRTNVITVFTYKLTDRFQYGSQYTAGIEQDGSVIHPGQNASWYGTEQLFTYMLDEKWSIGLRYEWVRDNDGARVAGVGNVLLTDRGWDGLPGMAGAYNDLSLGLNWRPNRNVTLRPEVRWDWYDGRPNAAGQLPFGDKDEREQFLLDADLIVTF
ncbi:MAG: porin [Planctomycetaceae bacterium]|nr:porin [Planctomycetaceae bacterium]